MRKPRTWHFVSVQCLLCREEVSGRSSPSIRHLMTLPSTSERSELGAEHLVGVEAQGGEVPGDLKAHETVQAAPDDDGFALRTRPDQG